MSKHSALFSLAPTAAAVVIAVHRPHGRLRVQGARGRRARRTGDQLARTAGARLSISRRTRGPGLPESHLP
jgi:hypothetical protein